MALGVVFAFCAALGFGTNQIFVRIATQRIPGPAAAFFSVVTGTVIAGTLALIFSFEDFKGLPPIAFAWYIFLAFLHHPLARTLNFTAISMIGASRAAPLSAAAPVFSAVLAIAVLGERPSIVLYLGTLVVIAGMTLVVTGGRQASSRAPQIAYNNLGYLLAFGASCGFGAVSVVTKHINTTYSPALVTVTFSLLLGTFLLGAGAHRPVIASLREDRRGFVPMTILAGVCAGAGAICFFSALGEAPVTVVVPIAFAAPLVTLVGSSIFLRRLERVNRLVIAGTLVAVCGVALVVLGRG